MGWAGVTRKAQKGKKTGKFTGGGRTKIGNKTKDSQNKNELTVHFTPLGKDILKDNRKARASLQKKYAKYFSDISQEEEGIIMAFYKDGEIL